MSEALYLRDPEGNGIEIYRDRPRDQWGRDGGELRMATLPLDLDGVLAELEPGDEAAERHAGRDDDGPRAPPGGRHPGGRGASTTAALGLDVMVRSYPGALFLSAGGYHHHVGLNTWQSQGAPPPPEGALGLDRYELVLPDEDDRRRRRGGAGRARRPGAARTRACWRRTRRGTGCC